MEASQGFQNKAVVGGIRQFATFWVEQAREAAGSEADRALVEQIAEMLSEYGRLPGTEARAKSIETLQTKVQQQLAKAKPATPPPAKQAPPPPSKPDKPAPQLQKTSPPPKYSPPPPPKKKAPPPATEAPAEPDPALLQQSVTAVKGVGPKLAERLAKLGAETIDDLLHIYPHRYDDYTLMKPIKDLIYGETVTVIGTVWESRARRTRSNKVVVQATISDGTAKVQATWFNQPWLADQLKAGMPIVISGTVDQYLGRRVFNSPQWERLEMDPLRTRRIVPVYPLTQGLTIYKMRDIMKTAVSRFAPRMADPLPADIRQRHNLYMLHQAIKHTHFPENQEALHEARRRLVFDELFLLQLGMQGFRHERKQHAGITIPYNEVPVIQFANTLPFEFTNAQKRVIKEIAADMAGDKPMNRLLQGDVGAGKTVVAAAAMILAVQGGYQAALMAPTEILAEQHYQGLSKLLAPLDISVCLLTGSTPASEKEQIYADLAAGTIQVAIGTHALIQESVTFDRLALAVIDEQHRFGVDQRQALRDKGIATDESQANPHLLVMSATPIPRSLALSLYGDLDFSALDEMPPGRQEIRTRWLRISERERAYSFIRGQVEQGRQAYVIYPLVEDSDKIDAKAAVSEYDRLQQEVFPDLKLGLIHGRLRGDEKEAVMRAFYEGDTQILVSTSVIEVGVDVPNASVMMIEGANRFGLAQLHQFRGRVGRGEHQSYCILIADNESAQAEERLRALEDTNDGFMLAEKDLEIRGPGEFFGRRQSGIPELRLASLLDMEMLEITRAEAEKLFQQDPMLTQPEHELLHDRVAQFWQESGDVS